MYAKKLGLTRSGMLYIYMLIILHELLNFLIRLLVRTKGEKFDLLLVRTDGIGDYIIWLDSLRAYKEAFKDKRVLLVCSKATLDIARLDPFFTKIVSLDRGQFLKVTYWYSFVKKIRQYTFDYAIAPAFSRSYVSDSVISVIRSKQRVGFRGDCLNMSRWQKHYMECFYTQLINTPLERLPEIDINAYFVRTLFSRNFQAQLPAFPVLPVSCSYVEGNYCVFFLSTNNLFHAWSVDRFVKIAMELVDKYKIILLGYGKIDQDLSDVFMCLSGNNGQIINKVNKTSFLETAQIVSHASLVIGNDTGGIHLATSLRVPSLAVVSGAHPGRFLPYPSRFSSLSYCPHVVFHQMDCFGCDYRCSRPMKQVYECIDSVDVESVRKELLSLLNCLK